MKTKNIFQLLVLILLLSYISKSYAQDPHLSQYDASPVILNPALTGMSDDQKYCAVTQFRSQWSAAGCNYTTTSLSFDMAYDDRWGFGGYLLNDDGSQVFNAFNFVLSGAYRITPADQKKVKLTVGLQAGLIDKSTKTNKLLFDNQYSHGNFDPDLPSGETYTHNNILMPEINFGIHYAGAFKDEKIKPYAGIAISHVTNPRESFYGSSDSHLPLKYVFHGGAKFEVSKGFILDPKFLIMKQRTATEINLGMQISYLLESTGMTFMGGGFYRLKDAAIFDLGFNYKNITYIISYDMNVSYLKAFTNKKGGIEFSVMFAK
jgi:type IX secretion system PorP/SprF family membrane protein